MLRRALPLLAVLTATVAGFARGDEDTRTALGFEQALREKGYFDLAGEYLDKLRSEKSTPDEIRTVIDYEFGRLLIDEAAKTGDLVRRKELLEQARGRLETFTKAHPNHELASEALVQLARLLVGAAATCQCSWGRRARTRPRRTPSSSRHGPPSTRPGPPTSRPTNGSRPSSRRFPTSCPTTTRASRSASGATRP